MFVVEIEIAFHARLKVGIGCSACLDPDSRPSPRPILGLDW